MELNGGTLPGNLHSSDPREGILIINGSINNVNGNFEFKGIVWINGNANNINGNMSTGGAVFINDSYSTTTDVTGSSYINYDPVSIDWVFYNASLNNTASVRNMLRWQEMD